MDWLRRLFGWSRRRDEALAEELESHRAMAQDELEGAGASRDDAVAESRRRMGNVALAREDSRDVWIVRWADRLRQHVKFGARGLRREPIFALTAILTLGLGSAATITVFSVVDAEVWRPLPYPDPHRLAAVRLIGRGNDSVGISIGELQEWRQSAVAFDSLAAEGPTERRTATIGRAESLLVTEVTANYFITLGRKPLMGRVLENEDTPAGMAAVLTERGWERVFDRDPRIVGRSIVLDGRPVTIVGLLARDDSMGPDAELFLPIDERASTAPLFSMIGRLAAGASIDIARQQVQAAVNRRAALDTSRRGQIVGVEDLSRFYRRTDQRPMFFFLGAAALVLLLTVANVAGLLVSRAIRRTPEFALRGALGGDAAALAGQTLVEGGLVAVPGCAVGLFLAYLAVGAAYRFVPAGLLGRGNHLGLDLRGAAFAFGIASATAVALAFLPLGIVRRTGARAALGSGHRTGESPRTARVRRVLLVGQLAVTVVLLTGASIFVKSFVALTTIPVGFDPAKAWSLRVTLSGPSHSTPAAIRAFIDSAVARLHAVPGVRYVAPATNSPLASGWLSYVKPHGDAREAGAGSETSAIFRAVGPEYFPATGTRIVRGRGVTADDRAEAPLVAVVSEEFVRRVFPGEDPIGKGVDFTGVHAAPVGSGTATIVGVAANIKEVGLNEVLFPDIYVPFAHLAVTGAEFIVRSDVADVGLPAALRAAMADPLVPVTSVSALSSRVDRALQPDRFNLIVVGGFAAMAVLMSAIGVYGAMAYAASTRRREFGVRLALGATPRAVVRGMLWSSARLALVAAMLGLGGALALAKAIGDALYLVPGSHNGLLYNVRTTDPLALGAALGGIVFLALMAGGIPAIRAGRIDPSQALRND